MNIIKKTQSDEGIPIKIEIFHLLITKKKLVNVVEDKKNLC